MTGKPKNSKEYTLLHENKDYLLVEDALKVLKIQLAQAEKDIVKLKAYKEKALKDPIGFVENLIDKKYKNIPKLQKVISIPNIDFSTYKPHSLRHTRSSSTNNTNTKSLFKDITYTEDTSPTSPNSNKKRLFEEDTNKNDTFYSETWTDDEINQLWNLLELYPEEDVPMSRYIKIAKRLETKSPKQVEKKVQTLSKKRRLTRKNLKPQKIAAESKIKAEKTLYSNRFSGAAYLSTPTVYMSDEEDGATLLGTGSVSMTSAAATATVDLNASQNTTRGRSNQRFIVNDDDSNDEDYEEPVSKPRRLHSMNSTGYSTRATSNSHTSTYMTRSSSLPLRGSRLNEEKKNRKLNSVTTKPDMNNIHYGIQCDRCGIEPIVGIRYKCKVCRGDHQTDLCEDCISKNYENEYHKASHEFDRIEKYIPEDNKTTVASDQYSYLGFSRQL
ncbi:hypothetical protein U3516DRAFT_813052 [Neocallimastix sp. 'constans']